MSMGAKEDGAAGAQTESGCNALPERVTCRRDIKAARRDLLKAMAAWTAAATLAGCLNNLWLRQLAQSGFSGRQHRVGAICASPLPPRPYTQRRIFRPLASAGCRQGSGAHAGRNGLGEELVLTNVLDRKYSTISCFFVHAGCRMLTASF
jgi:hypothetical protein